jgi:hypothetical protein
MNNCSGCGRHLLESSNLCPFCGSSRKALGSLRNKLGVLASAAVLAACYGAPPGDLKYDTSDTGGIMDADADGWILGEDCDDQDAEVNPEAAEVCDDGVDNDCDGAMDAEDSDCID